MECFLIDLEIGAKNCGMKRIPSKDDDAGRTGFHTRTMILRIVIYKVAINLLADLEWKTQEPSIWCYCSVGDRQG